MNRPTLALLAAIFSALSPPARGEVFWIPLEAVWSDTHGAAQCDALVAIHSAYRDDWIALERGRDRRGEPPHARAERAPDRGATATAHAEQELERALLAQLVELELIPLARAEALRRDRAVERALDDPAVGELFGGLSCDTVFDVVDLYDAAFLSPEERDALRTRWAREVVTLHERVVAARQSWYGATRELGAFARSRWPRHEELVQARTAQAQWRDEFTDACAHADRVIGSFDHLIDRLAPRGLVGRGAAIQLALLTHGLSPDPTVGWAADAASLTPGQRARLEHYLDVVWTEIDATDRQPCPPPGISALRHPQDLSRAIRQFRMNQIRLLEAEGITHRPFPVAISRPAVYTNPAWPEIPPAGALVSAIPELEIMLEAHLDPALRAADAVVAWRAQREACAAQCAEAATAHVLGHRVRPGEFFSTPEQVRAATAWVEAAEARIAAIDAELITALSDGEFASNDVAIIDLWLRAERVQPILGPPDFEVFPGGAGNREAAVNLFTTIAALPAVERDAVVQQSADAVIARYERMHECERNAWSAGLTASAALRMRRPPQPDWAALGDAESQAAARDAHRVAVEKHRDQQRAASTAARQAFAAMTSARRERVAVHADVLAHPAFADHPDVVRSYRTLAFPELTRDFEAARVHFAALADDPRLSAMITERILPTLSAGYHDAIAASRASLDGEGAGPTWFGRLVADLRGESSARSR